MIADMAFFPWFCCEAAEKLWIVHTVALHGLVRYGLYVSDSFNLKRHKIKVIYYATYV